MGNFSLSFDVNRGIPEKNGEWIMYRLLNRHSDIVKQGGADIDGDGKMEVFGNFDGVDGVGNPGDFQGFYEKYKAMIQKKYPEFLAAEMFDRVVGGKTYPLIHNAMAISDLRIRYENVPPHVDMLCVTKFTMHGGVHGKNHDKDFRASVGVGFLAYSDLACAYIDAKDAIKRATTTEGKLKALVKAVGPDFSFLTRGKIDCEGTYFDEALIASAMFAKQFELSDVDTVKAPYNKLLLRYKQEDGKFSYIDSRGRVFSHMEMARNVSEQAKKGVYLRPLSDRELLGMLVFNRGGEWLKLGDTTWDKTGKPMFSTGVAANIKYYLQGVVDYKRSLFALPMDPTVMNTVGGFYYQSAKHNGLAKLFGWSAKLRQKMTEYSKELINKTYDLDPTYQIPRECQATAVIEPLSWKKSIEDKSFLDKYSTYIVVGGALVVGGLVAWRLFRGRWGR